MVDQTVYRETELAIFHTKLTALEDMIYSQAVTIANLEEEVERKKDSGVVGDTLPLHQVADLIKACAGDPAAEYAMRRVAQVLSDLRPDSCYKIPNIKLLRASFGLSLKDAKHLIESPHSADLSGYPYK